MKPGIRYIIFFFLLHACFLTAFSQAPSVKITADKDKILIGEPIQVTLQSTVPAGLASGWYTVDSLPHFELIDKGKIDTIINADGSFFKQVITLTSFDSGQWAIPAMSLEIDKKKYVTDSLMVSVAFSNFDPNKDYHDIKDIIEIENPRVKYITWIVLALGIISLVAAIYFLRKRHILPAKIAQEPVSKLSPIEEAMQLLDKLKKTPVQDKQEIKLYYTSLNDVLRRYLQRKTGVAQTEKTNGEIALQLQGSKWPKDELLQLAQTLRLADVVKFAKYVPAEEENKSSFDSIKNSIQSLDKFLS